MQIDFNLIDGVCKMLEIMDKSVIAKRFMWAVLIFTFIVGMTWLSPDFLKALADFILTLKNS